MHVLSNDHHDLDDDDNDTFPWSHKDTRSFM